jgi:anti-sigma factor RsiW
MNSTNDPLQPDPADEQMLFDAYRAACPDAAGDVDLLDIAAWLDGTLGDDESAALESEMARDARVRELASAHRLEPDLVTEPVAAELLARLHELRPEPTTPLRFSSPATRSGSRAWWASSAAAAGIVVAFAGFLAGRLAATESYTSEDRFLATATFNVFDDDAASQFDEVLFTVDDDMEGER